MQSQIQRKLSRIPLGSFRYYDTISSTNDEALTWAAQGAPDFSLVIADEQTHGRGRMDRKWFTPPGAALAFSLILHPATIERTHPSRATGLLAVSLVEALRDLGLAPQVKWPNDVLISGRKVAGILVESSWESDELNTLILGMGVNVLRTSIPPADQLQFPATSVETESGHPIDRIELLKNILEKVSSWRPKLGMDAFLKTWNENLAYRGQQVRIEGRGGNTVTGKLLGLEADGSLHLRDEHSKSVIVHSGEVHLRPLA